MAASRVRLRRQSLAPGNRRRRLQIVHPRPGAPHPGADGGEQAKATLRGYLNVLADFNHGKCGSVKVVPDDFDTKVLRVAIPKGKREAFKDAFDDAAAHVKTLNLAPARGIRAIKKMISLEFVEYEVLG